MEDNNLLRSNMLTLNKEYRIEQKENTINVDQLIREFY